MFKLNVKIKSQLKTCSSYPFFSMHVKKINQAISMLIYDTPLRPSINLKLKCAEYNKHADKRISTCYYAPLLLIRILNISLIFP